MKGENFFKRQISRREFLKRSFFSLLLAGASTKLFAAATREARAKTKTASLREAMFYKKLGKDKVQCGICFRRCTLNEGERSFCRNKENVKGRLYNLVHSKPSAVQIDPVEKEPAFHMLPGTQIFCLGTAGCNFRCKFCHNWHLSQRPIEEMDYVYDMPPERAADISLSKKIPTVSFTYNEPTSFYEYVYDTARHAKQKGLKVLWHTNGSVNPEPLKELLKYSDAVTVDLKGFTDEFYQNISSARLEPVLETLKTIKGKGIWLEIVNLLIPGLNDNSRDLTRMCIWIKENLGKDTPLHFSRFSPAYRLKSIPPTPIDKLEKAHVIAEEAGLEYVTIGNVPGHKYNSTFCPKCGERLIYRIHFKVLNNNVTEGRCRFCGYPISGIWS